MIKADRYYLEKLNTIMDYGTFDEDPRPKYKDGTPAFSKFITQVYNEYDISKGEFPIPTLRNTSTKMGINEIFWIYQKQSNKLSEAHELGINWWDSWDIGDGTIGQRYGATVKKYGLMDRLLDGLRNQPFSRRHYIELLQENDLMETKGLHPCAHLTEWSVRKLNGEMYVDMTLTQRSNDFITAGAINEIQYVAFMMMVCGDVGYKVGKFAHLTQNVHVYDRHFDAVAELLQREPLEQQPILRLKENKSFYDYTIDDFEILNIKGIKKITSPLELAI